MSELDSGIFQGAVPLRFEEHRHLRFSDRQDYRFAARLTEVPLAYTEWVSAARHYPVVFSGPKPGSLDRAVAMLKLAPEDVSPFLRADDGHWLPNHYIPQYLGFYPFALKMTDPTTPVLMGVIEAPHFSDSIGEPLFSKTGEMNPFLEERYAALKTYLEHLKQTRSLIELLGSMGLLSQVKVSSNEDPDQDRLAEVVSVTLEKLAKLSPEALGQLNQRGALPLAFAQVHSLENIGRLHRASRALLEGSQDVPAGVEPATIRPIRETMHAGREKRYHHPGIALGLGMTVAFLLGSWLGPEWESGPPTERLASSKAEAPLPDHKDMAPDQPPLSAAPEPEPAIAESIADTEDEPVGVDTVSDEDEAPSTVVQERIATVAPPVSDVEDEGAEETETVTATAPSVPDIQPEDSLPEVAHASETQTGPEFSANQADPPVPPVAIEQTRTEAAESKAATATPPSLPDTPQAESLPEESQISKTQTEPAEQKEDAAPSLTPAAREEIANLLRGIGQDIRRDRLTLPEHDNAVDKIDRILALDPGNRSARSALYDVVDRYILLARRARGRRGKAYLQSAHQAAPDLLEIDLAWEELYAPEPPAWYPEPQN